YGVTPLVTDIAATLPKRVHDRVAYAAIVARRLLWNRLRSDGLVAGVFPSGVVHAQDLGGGVGCRALASRGVWRCPAETEGSVGRGRHRRTGFDGKRRQRSGHGGHGPRRRGGHGRRRRGGHGWRRRGGHGWRRRGGHGWRRHGGQLGDRRHDDLRAWL